VEFEHIHQHKLFFKKNLWKTQVIKTQFGSSDLILNYSCSHYFGLESRSFPGTCPFLLDWSCANMPLSGLSFNAYKDFIFYYSQVSYLPCLDVINQSHERFCFGFPSPCSPSCFLFMQLQPKRNTWVESIKPPWLLFLFRENIFLL
jgi:hypothetical protein